MERFLTVFIFGWFFRFLIRTTRNLVPKLGKRVYCDGCGTTLPRNKLKHAVKSRKGSRETAHSSNPAQPYNPYTPESDPESIDNKEIAVMKFCLECGTPTPIIYLSKFSKIASLASILLVVIASVTLLMGNCVVVVSHMGEMAIPMAFFTIFIGGPAVLLGVLITGAVGGSGAYIRAFIIGLIPVLLVSGTCSGMFFNDIEFQSEKVYESIEGIGEGINYTTTEPVTPMLHEQVYSGDGGYAEQYTTSVSSYNRIRNTSWASQYKIKSVSATCDSRRIHDVYLRFYESINYVKSTTINHNNSWSSEQEQIFIWNKVVEYLNLELKPSGEFMKAQGYQTVTGGGLSGSRYRSYPFNDIIECTAQEVAYIVNVVPLMRYACEFPMLPASGLCNEVEIDLSFKDHVLADESDLWMYDGLEVVVNAYLFISEDETPDIKAKDMKLTPKTGVLLTPNTILSWQEQHLDSQYAIKYGGGDEIPLE